MYEGPVAESHHLVQGRNIVFSELMLDKLFSHTRVSLSYFIQVHDYIYPFIFDGKVEDIEALFEINVWQLFNRYAKSVKIDDIIVCNRIDKPLLAVKVL